MSFGQIIKGTLLPKVPLKTLFEEDNSQNSTNPSSTKRPNRAPDNSQMIGAREPYIKIGDQIVKNIDSLVIDETGFIPTLSLTFVDSFGEFAGDYFPKTNLILNLYLKSASEKFKPIRSDFLIKSMKAIPPKHSDERKGITLGTTYIVKGELFIPNLYQSVSGSYPNLTSKEALKKICEELSLGFAENESSPNDKMTWLNINLSRYHFMQHIVNHAYQTDDSFFTAFIDKYYYLNYVEVNRQLRAEEADQTFITTSNALAMSINQKVKEDAAVKSLEEETTVNYLTTETQFKGSPNYIQNLSLISSQGDVLKSKGYKKEIYYYDHLRANSKPIDKFKHFYMAPLKSDDRKQTTYLVPEEASLADNTIKKWMNIDYGNTHVEWNAARLINTHNMSELDKIKLKVSLYNINFQVARGYTIPVYITVQQAEKILKATDVTQDTVSQATDAPSLTEQTIDTQLSGSYYVAGAKYHYDSLHPNGLYTELYLARREWNPSKKTE